MADFPVPLTINHVLSYSFISFISQELLKNQYTKYIIDYFSVWVSRVSESFKSHPDLAKRLGDLDRLIDTVILTNFVDQLIAQANAISTRLQLERLYPWNALRSARVYVGRYSTPIFKPVNSVLITSLDRYLPTSGDKFSVQTHILESDDELTKNRKILREIILRLKIAFLSRYSSIQSVYKQELKDESNDTTPPTVTNRLNASYKTALKIATSINSNYISPIQKRVSTISNQTSDQIIDLVTSTKNNVDHLIEEARSNLNGGVNGIKANGVDILNSSNTSSVPVETAA